MTIPGPRAGGGGSWTENMTVYLDPVNGDDTKSGTCPATAVKTFAQAYLLVLALTPNVNNRARLACMPGTITLANSFTWDIDCVVIEGLGGRDQTIIEYGRDQVINLTAIDVEFNNIWIRATGSAGNGSPIYVRGSGRVDFNKCRLTCYGTYLTGAGVYVNHASAVVIFNQCRFETIYDLAGDGVLTIVNCTRVETHDCEYNGRVMPVAGEYFDYNGKSTLVGSKYGYYITSTIKVTLIGSTVISDSGTACVYAGGTGLVSVLGCFLDNGGSSNDLQAASITYPIRCRGTVMRSGMGQYARQIDGIHRTGAGQYGVDQHPSVNTAVDRMAGYKLELILDGDSAINVTDLSPNAGSDVVVNGQGRYKLYGASDGSPLITVNSGTRLVLQDVEIDDCYATLTYTGVLIMRRCIVRGWVNINDNCEEGAGLYVEDSTFIAPNGYGCVNIDDLEAVVRLTNSDFYCYVGGAKSAIILLQANPNLELSGCVVTGLPADPTTVYPISNPPAATAITSHRTSYNCDPFIQANLSNNVGTPYDVVDPDCGSKRREP